MCPNLYQNAFLKDILHLQQGITCAADNSGARLNSLPLFESDYLITTINCPFDGLKFPNENNRIEENPSWWQLIDIILFEESYIIFFSFLDDQFPVL